MRTAQLQQRSFDVPSGVHILKWRYTKDSSESAGTDQAWLDQVSYTPPGEFAPIILQEPLSQTVAAGAIVTFTVVGAGMPQPTYRWYFNGASLSGATNSTHRPATTARHRER